MGWGVCAGGCGKSEGFSLGSVLGVVGVWRGR